MRILVLHTQIPFASGGAEVLSHGLVSALRERGHEAEIVALPLQWNPPDRLLDTAMAWRMLDLSQVGGRTVDAVICTKFPTWAVRHSNKLLWLVHQHRQAYDLFGTAHSEFGSDEASRRLRSDIFSIDRKGIGECRRRFAISENVAARLQDYLGIDAAPLYPPVEDRELWPERFDPYVLSVARLDALKRVSALVEAWPDVDDRLRLKIVSDGPDRDSLVNRARELGVAERIEFLGRVDDASLAALYRQCRVVYYAPLDEDYGYTAVEALAAGKPVITAPDSGGVLEFVRNQETGSVTELEKSALAKVVNRYVDADMARRRGARGKPLTEGISWDNVVQSLLGDG